MQPMLIEAFQVLVACLAMAGAAIAIVLLRPTARRRRRHRRHSARPKIDLFKPAHVATPPEKDA